MTQENFIKYYDDLNICDRAEIHKVWINELYKLAKVCKNAEIIDQHTKPGNCCPCIIFEADGFRAVAYLHSDCFRPAMWFGGADGYMSIDYRDMLAVLYGNFANVTAPDYLGELPAPATADSIESEAETITAAPATPADIESEAETITAAPAADSLAAKVADVARVWLLCCCLTAAAPAAADSIETDTPADVCELLTADPLAQVAEFAAAGLTVSHVTIKSLPAREIPAADVPVLLTC